LIPDFTISCAAVCDREGMIKQVVIHDKMLLRVKAQDFFEPRKFFCAKFSSVDTPGVLLGGRWPTNNSTQSNYGWFVGFLLRIRDRFVKCFYIFYVVTSLEPVDTLDMPTISLIAFHNVFGKGNIGIVFDRNFIIVPNYNQVPQLLGACK